MYLWLVVSPRVLRLIGQFLGMLFAKDLNQTLQAQRVVSTWIDLIRRRGSFVRWSILLLSLLLWIVKFDRIISGLTCPIVNAHISLRAILIPRFSVFLERDLTVLVTTHVLVIAGNYSFPALLMSTFTIIPHLLYHGLCISGPIPIRQSSLIGHTSFGPRSRIT